MKFSAYLSSRRVRVIDGESKTDAINAALAALEGHPSVRSHSALREAIWKREEVLPTGIGLGIGVPHVRSDVIRDPVAVLAVLRNGVDYGAIDGVPVRVILLIAMPDGKHNDYLAYLAKASRCFQKADFRNALMECDTADAVWELVEEL